MRKIIFLVSLFVFTWSLPLSAQDEAKAREAYSVAENEYRIGRLNQAIDLLKQHINSYEGNLKQNALRLMALCYLGQDKEVETEQCAKALLTENPYYTSVQDPIRFEEIINRLRSGRAFTVTTASSQEESINEAPVPVTIITRDMIEMLGYNKTLAQILAFFIPGMTEVASNKLENVAMHGAYTMGQEKILVMENGHRLNVRSTNMGQMDYSVSTEKIDHIEVLRGPASSLYGNVALTAVVNIITLQGGSVDGVSGRYGYGSFGSHKADMVAGGNFLGGQFSFWGSLFKSNGEERYEPQGTGFTASPWNGNAHVAKYRDRPSYDLGVSFNVGDFRVYFSRKYSQKATQYSLYSNTYTYNKYRQINGQKPGYSIEGILTEASYHKKVLGTDIEATVYADWYTMGDYSAASDEQEEYDLDESGNPKTDAPKILYKGIYSYINWRERTIGGLLKLNRSYRIGSMKGNILIGGQYENFNLFSSDNIIGQNFEQVMNMFPESENPIENGMENSLSFFMQDKHYFSKKLILNAGLRYDRKFRADDSHINAFSPRLALIVTPDERFNVKFSYAHSFVDAPYFYRRNNDTSYKGAADLTPELMNSVQLDVLGNLRNLHLTYDVNLFYNRVSDMVIKVDGSMLDVKFKNSGLLETVGAETTLNYNHRGLMANLVLCYNHILSAANIDYYDNHRMNGVAPLTGSIQVADRVLHQSDHDIWVVMNAKYRNSMLVSASSLSGKNLSDYSLTGGIVCDLGLRYRYGKHLQVSFDCENVFNRTEYVCGTTLIPEFMIGRMLMASLKVGL